MEKIRLLIADDHPAFREGLARLLQEEGDLECVATSADGMEAVKLAKELQPDVAVIDVSMPNLNGIQAAKQIRAACPNTAILMISAFNYQSYVLASFQAGATGYMLKDRPLRELVSAIRLVSSGDSVFDLNATNTMLRFLNSGGNESEMDSEHLLPRELDVIKLITKGMNNKDIAEHLFISERTVQTHLVNIFRKLEVNSRTQAAIYALRKGWVSIDNLS